MREKAVKRFLKSKRKWWNIKSYFWIYNLTYCKCYIDELIICPNEYVNSDLFVNHYNNNTLWGKDFIP